MRSLAISFVVSIWPMRCTIGHLFDGETHEWWAAFGPVGVNLYFEPR
jgi:hypothetical protein